jgi:Domain of unknown function (DUF397)
MAACCWPAVALTALVTSFGDQQLGVRGQAVQSPLPQHVPGVEPGARHGQDGNCVEVARNLPGLVAVRDSMKPGGAKLLVSRETWRAFLLALRA